jgi:hypothetical protein
MGDVDLRLLDRFRIAQRLNRGGRQELRALERLRARVEEQRARIDGGPRPVADVLEFPRRD